jgi:hypothetical protein
MLMDLPPPTNTSIHIGVGGMTKIILACLVLAVLPHGTAWDRFHHMLGKSNLIFQTIAVRSIPAVLGALLVTSPMEAHAYAGHADSVPSSYSASLSPRLDYHGYGNGGAGAAGGGMPIPDLHMHTNMLVSGSLENDLILLDESMIGTCVLLGFYTAVANFSTYGSLLGKPKKTEELGPLGKGATVMKLQVALDSNWAEKGNIMDTLSVLLDRKESRDSYPSLYSDRHANLLSEASVALLRKRASWSAASIQNERFWSWYAQDKAQLRFQQLAVGERVQIHADQAPSWDINAAKPARVAVSWLQQLQQIPAQMGGTSSSSSSTSSTSTTAVVSLVVMVRGETQALRVSGTPETDVAAALTALAAEALYKEENIMLLELLWSPSGWGSTLSLSDLIGYPELMSL